ncbi:MAG: twin-arginine translocase subunit TatC [Planctomycetota bacterium]
MGSEKVVWGSAGPTRPGSPRMAVRDAWFAVGGWGVHNRGVALDQDFDNLVTDEGVGSAERDAAVDEMRMPLGDHLDELRGRLIKAGIAVGLAAAGSLFFGKDLVGWLLRPLGRALSEFGLPAQAYGMHVATGFAVYLKVSLITGLIVATPLVLYQFWRFVASGLYTHERRFVYALTPFSTVMAGLAVAFMYYVLLPICLAFLLFFTTTFPPIDPGDGGGDSLIDLVARLATGQSGEKAVVEPTATGESVEGLASLPLVEGDPEAVSSGSAWVSLPSNELRVRVGDQTLRYLPVAGPSGLQPLLDIQAYLSFVVLLMVGVLIGFQLPVVMFVLGVSGLVEPGLLARYRKYALLGSFALGALLTPADPISMLVLAVPLYGLFELGLVAMRLGRGGLRDEP